VVVGDGEAVLGFEGGRGRLHWVSGGVFLLLLEKGIDWMIG